MIIHAKENNENNNALREAIDLDSKSDIAIDDSQSDKIKNNGDFIDISLANKIDLDSKHNGNDDTNMAIKIDLSKIPMENTNISVLTIQLTDLIFAKSEDQLQYHECLMKAIEARKMSENLSPQALKNEMIGIMDSFMKILDHRVCIFSSLDLLRIICFDGAGSNIIDVLKRIDMQFANFSDERKIAVKIIFDYLINTSIEEVDKIGYENLLYLTDYSDYCLKYYDMNIYVKMKLLSIMLFYRVIISMPVSTGIMEMEALCNSFESDESVIVKDFASNLLNTLKRSVLNSALESIK